MNHNFDLVSVIIPAFNRDDIIISALLSVIYQHYQFIEIIIIDDGSTDSSLKLIENCINLFVKNANKTDRIDLNHIAGNNINTRLNTCVQLNISNDNSSTSIKSNIDIVKYLVKLDQTISKAQYNLIKKNLEHKIGWKSIKQEYNTLKSFPYHRAIKLVKHSKNFGVGAARNSGLKAARSEYIFFFDSDDYFLPNHIDKICKAMKFHGLKVMQCEEYYSINNSIVLLNKKHFKPGGYIFSDSIKQNRITVSSLCVKNEIFNTTGYFDEVVPVMEDYGFFCF